VLLPALHFTSNKAHLKTLILYNLKCNIPRKQKEMSIADVSLTLNRRLRCAAAASGAEFTIEAVSLRRSESAEM
jgi:hypothetical protein